LRGGTGVGSSLAATRASRRRVREQEIPKDVRALLIEHIDSVVQAEILLLLHAAAGRSFTAAEVGNELRIDAAGAEAQLTHLQARGLLRAGGGAGQFAYGPRTAQLDAAVAGLARAYADRRVSVISLIYSKPTDQLRSFADAFKLRRDEDTNKEGGGRG
jgi:hypothetical protein